MGDGALFDAVADALQRRAGMEALAARGTLRIALKGAGLDAKAVTGAQLAVVIERILPKELESRGVQDVSSVCAALVEAARAAASAGAGAAGASPEDVFRRIRELSATG
jgi:hypothetical protein